MDAKLERITERMQRLPNYQTTSTHIRDMYHWEKWEIVPTMQAKYHPTSSDASYECRTGLQEWPPNSIAIWPTDMKILDTVLQNEGFSLGNFGLAGPSNHPTILWVCLKMRTNPKFQPLSFGEIMITQWMAWVFPQIPGTKSISQQKVVRL